MSTEAEPKKIPMDVERCFNRMHYEGSREMQTITAMSGHLESQQAIITELQNNITKLRATLYQDMINQSWNQLQNRIEFEKILRHYNMIRNTEI
jgi:hypothetical protein